MPDLGALRARLRYRDFIHFLASWMWMTGIVAIGLGGPEQELPPRPA